MSSSASAKFIDVNCPVCAGRDSKELRAAANLSGLSLADLKAAYSASSDHALLDRVVECRDCGMVYITPRLDAGMIQEGYETVEDPVFVEQNPQRIRTFSRNIRSILRETGLDAKGRRLLDIGCAGGAFLVAARDAGFLAQGIEPSRWLSEFGRRQYQLDIRQGIVTPDMFPAGTFDVVTLWDVIEHVPEPQSVLETVHALLKPQGYLWVNYPDAGSAAAKLAGWRWPFWLSVHLHYYKRHTMRRQLEQAGFEISYMHPHWQQLQLGYVLRRGAALVPPLKLAERMVVSIGLGGIPFTYNMGQTLVIARRKQS
jgi:SAM-dependent methyltransferase